MSEKLSKDDQEIEDYLEEVYQKTRDKICSVCFEFIKECECFEGLEP